MRVITLTLHPAIDRAVEVDELRAGATFNGRLLLTVPAGKGVNTARVLRLLWRADEQVWAAVWLGGAEAAWFKRRLAALSGVRAAICPRACATRYAQTFLERSGRETHIKEAMAPARPDEERALLAFWRELVHPGDVVALCGSAPAHTSMRTLRRLFELARQKKARALIADSNGPALVAAGEAGLDGLKGNAAEIGEWLGLAGPFEPAKARQRRALLAAFQRKGAPRAILITLGAEGAALALPGGIFHARPPVIESGMANVSVPLAAVGLPVRKAPSTGSPTAASGTPRVFQSATGCGDAATAGWLWALLERCGPEETVRRAVACGTAKLAATDPGTLALRRVRQLLRAVKVTQIN